MRDSETFGVEKGHGEEVVTWLNQQSKDQGSKFEASRFGNGQWEIKNEERH